MALFGNKRPFICTSFKNYASLSLHKNKEKSLVQLKSLTSSTAKLLIKICEVTPCS